MVIALATMTSLACKQRSVIHSTHLIPVDSANKMMESYLSSIHHVGNDSTLRSLTFDAAVLRDYLNATPSGVAVTKVKVMFAHTLDYINGGNGGNNAGYRSGALTLIMAGYDNDGNYVLLDNSVIDNAIPCPANCPPGNAGQPLIPLTIAINE